MKILKSNSLFLHQFLYKYAIYIFIIVLHSSMNDVVDRKMMVETRKKNAEKFISIKKRIQIEYFLKRIIQRKRMIHLGGIGGEKK